VASQAIAGARAALQRRGCTLHRCNSPEQGLSPGIERRHQLAPAGHKEATKPPARAGGFTNCHPTASHASGRQGHVGYADRLRRPLTPLGPLSSRHHRRTSPPPPRRGGAPLRGPHARRRPPRTQVTEATANPPSSRTGDAQRGASNSKPAAIRSMSGNPASTSSPGCRTPCRPSPCATAVERRAPDQSYWSLARRP
jgi:hypothetical protein